MRWWCRVETLYCSRAQCLGWVYILLSLVCPLRGLALLPATHQPAHLPAPAHPRSSLYSCALSSAASDDTRSISEVSPKRCMKTAYCNIRKYIEIDSERQGDVW